VRKRSARVGWGLLALGLVGNVAGVVLSVINDRFLQDSGQDVALTLAFGSFLVVGCVLLARRPGNIIGWIFTAVGLLTTAAILAEGYTTYAYITHPGPLPGRLLAVWVYNWIWLPIGMLTVVFPLLLFPTGRPLSARWRPVIWLAVGVTVGWAVLGALNPSLAVSDDRSVANPIGVSGADPNAGLASTILNGLLQFLLAAAIVSVVVRFRRSHGVERQQLKWFAYAGALVVLGMLSTLVLPSLGNLPWVMVAALPVAVGIAILRYRLYDIDRLINRTLVYGSLTAILGLGYAGAVLILGQVFGGVTEDPPSWAVAGTTLAVAALFQPARRRIQAVVDRRFNRRKYNAAKTVETFSARLRDEVDLDALSAELLAVAHQTMQPTMAALWLRPSPQARPRGQGHGS
jgi:MFS family permease